MFGGDSAAAAPTAEPTAAASPAAASDSDSRELSNANPGRDAFASGENTDNPLQIGGIYYQQLNHRGASEGDNSLSAPTQLDIFLDGRPNDRIRANVTGRLLYDSTKDSSGRSSVVPSGTGLPFYITSTTAAAGSNPSVVLDQAWLKFDMDHTVFVTAGKQHVKWGTGHVWNPSDQLNPARLDPLQPYDLRLGSNMIKFDAPLSAVRGNLSAAALLDNPQPAGKLQQVGGAFRAEGVILGAELGADAVFRDGIAPDYGFDLSTGLGSFDVYAEAAILSGDHSYPVLDALPNSGAALSSLYHEAGIEGHALQAVAGLSYAFNYIPNRTATLVGEYFYNELGVEPALYPVLIFFGRYQAFYAGRHYAAAVINLEGPDASNKTNYSLSNIENISDLSAVSRLDFSWKILDYLTFGAFGDLHWGSPGGEFNYTLRSPALIYDRHDGSLPRTISPIYVPLQPYDLGLSLRVSY